MLHYAAYEGMAKATFVVFTLTFVVTRLVILPFWLTWSVAFDISALFGNFTANYLFTGCLLLLQVCICTLPYPPPIVCTLAYPPPIVCTLAYPPPMVCTLAHPLPSSYGVYTSPPPTLLL